MGAIGEPGCLLALTRRFVFSSRRIAEVASSLLQLCCKCLDKVTHAVDQTAKQPLGDRVLPARLRVIFLHLAPSHTCNRVAVHMNARRSAGTSRRSTRINLSLRAEVQQTFNTLAGQISVSCTLIKHRRVLWSGGSGTTNATATRSWRSWGAATATRPVYYQQF